MLLTASKNQLWFGRFSMLFFSSLFHLLLFQSVFPSICFAFSLFFFQFLKLKSYCFEMSPSTR